MDAKAILQDQVIRLKRGRLNGLGFEPAYNAFFDFYLSSKYIDPPLLRLEDVTFFLFLRKNLNDQNPEWRMPSMRQMTRKFRIGQHRIEAIMERLDQAQLLKKQSGRGAGPDGENVTNHYLLSDPLPTLDEFLLVALSGVFGQPLREEWREFVTDDPCSQYGYTPVAETATPPVAETATPPVAETARDQQTLTTKQGVLPENDFLWNAVLENLKSQLPSTTFYNLVADTRLATLENGVATILTPRAGALEWLTTRLAKKVKLLLTIEAKIAGKEISIAEVRFEVFSAPDENHQG
jgi:hypothetical protein